MDNKVKKLTDAGAAPAQIADGIYVLATIGCVSYSYMVVGKDKALVIDTGLGDADVYANARKVTDLPLELVNTHGHGDHIGCNEKFDVVYAHPADHAKVSRKNKDIIPVQEGYVFDLGGRKLEVIETPGHTPGSICILDRANKILFMGDSLYAGPLFLQFEYSSLKDYIASIDKLVGMSDVIEYLLICHGDVCPMTLEDAKKARNLAQMLLDGKAPEGEPVHLDTEDGGYDVKVYSYDGAMIYYQ